jgi:hypothetical protein
MALAYREFSRNRLMSCNDSVKVLEVLKACTRYPDGSDLRSSIDQDVSAEDLAEIAACYFEAAPGDNATE